jgi:methyltransferase (TIGR00027 family)
MWHAAWAIRRGVRLTGNRTWDVVSGPGITALGLAASRSVESTRPDRLIEDPWAAAFIAAVDSPVAFPTRWPAGNESVTDQQALHLHGSRYIGVRSRFYDDFLLGAAQRGVRQVVLLAAGLDTRAFKLSWPSGVTVFEIDQPQVIAFKDEVMHDQGAQAACRRVTIGVDLREDWQKPLLAAGFTADLRTAWVAEGLLAYLPPDAEEHLLLQINELSAPGSTIAADRILAADRLDQDDTALEELSRRSGVEMASLIDTRARRDCAQWLRAHGWTVHEDHATGIAQNYGRDLSDPFSRQKTPPWLETGFVTAHLTHDRP